MPPLIRETKSDSDENITEHYIGKEDTLDHHHEDKSIGTCEAPHPTDRIVWRNVAIMGALHLTASYGLILCFTTAKWQTIIAAIVLYIIGGLGITAGAHRLWSHKSYKARFPLRFVLMIFNCVAFQNDIYEWSRDHRVHHKFSETDADPHNAKRGFFFSHVGWLLARKHPAVFSKGKTIDCSDILADPLVRFQRRHYLKLVAIFSFIMPSLLCNLGWSESLVTSFVICGALKYVVTLHATWLVNSAAHMWGNRPYDKHINPSQNIFVSLGAIGEGFHNYHHTFPWDYAASEYGIKINLTTLFIDTMAKFGLAYDRKIVSSQVVSQRKERTGDGSDHHKNTRSNHYAQHNSIAQHEQ